MGNLCQNVHGIVDEILRIIHHRAIKNDSGAILCAGWAMSKISNDAVRVITRGYIVIAVWRAKEEE
jgi:hypothetical protein